MSDPRLHKTIGSPAVSTNSLNNSPSHRKQNRIDGIENRIMSFIKRKSSLDSTMHLTAPNSPQLNQQATTSNQQSMINRKFQEKLIRDAKARVRSKFEQFDLAEALTRRRNSSTSESAKSLNGVAASFLSPLPNIKNHQQNSSSPETESAPITPYSSASSSSADFAAIAAPTVNQENDCEQIEIRLDDDDVTNEIECQLRETALRLQEELRDAKMILLDKDKEIAKYSKFRSEVYNEIEDLTAVLFEEANKMTFNALQAKQKADKLCQEALMKIDVLQAEVKVLKQLVVASTPTKSTPISHNKLDRMRPTQKVNNSPLSTPRKSPSSYELGCHENCHFDSNGIDYESDAQQQTQCTVAGEIDPIFHQQFFEWKKNPCLSNNNSFMKGIYEQEIYPVFNFKNQQLTQMVLTAIEDNSIAIEYITDKSQFPKRCALLEIPRSCRYRMKLCDNWYNISQLCRNRIIAVCDLFCYLRYIKQGLVKSSFHEVYWEVMQRRKNIALTRLGFYYNHP